MLKAAPFMDELIALAQDAGEVIHENFRLGIERTFKNDGSLVTKTDTDINRMVIDRLSQQYPHVRIVGEEESFEGTGSEYMILCDPLDGTIPFCHGVPISTFVISLLKDGRPIKAVIHDPFLRRTWFAEKDEGAYLATQSSRLKQCKVSSQNWIDRASITACWWKDSPFHIHEVVAELMKSGATVGNPLSPAYCGGLLAFGEQDAIIFAGRHGWETAAMQLIAEEAGGIATDIHGHPLRYGPKGEIEGHIISNGALHERLVEIVAPCQPLGQ